MIENNCKTVYASFCGTGKSFLCNIKPEKYKEIECWNYREGDFPNNYIEEIKRIIGSVDHLFISTDPVILNQLKKEGFEIFLIYPDISLKEEYMERYCERKDSYDFIGVMYRHWKDRLDELKKIDYCKHIILQKKQYLLDVL